METSLYYLLRVSIAAIVLYSVYKLVLSKKTFHSINRAVILGIVGLTMVLPLFTIQLPKMDWFSAPEQPSQLVSAPMMMSNESNLMFASYATTPIENQAVEIPWLQIFILVYLSGVGVSLIRLFVSFAKIKRIIRKAKKKELTDNAWLCITTKNVSPFSWMKYIVIQEKDMEDDNHEIIRHEQAHISYKHSQDMLLVNLYTVLFWFNPFAWMLRHELQIVHEYQADEKVLAQGADLKYYQLLLIRKCVGDQKFALAHNFEYNNLQKRIKMTMEAKSSAKQKWMYFSILTAVFIAVGVLSWDALQAKGVSTDANKLLNDSTVVVDTCSMGTQVVDNSQLKLVKGTIVDLDNNPVVDANVIAENDGHFYQLRRNGLFTVPSAMGKKLMIRLYDGSHYRCEFIVSDSTKISRLKIVLQGHVWKNDWAGLKVYTQTEEEDVATNKMLVQKMEQYIRDNKILWGYGMSAHAAKDYNVVIDGILAKTEDRFKTPSDDVLQVSTESIDNYNAQNNTHLTGKLLFVETKSGLKNAKIYLNDTEITYEEFLNIFADPTCMKSLSVIRDKQKLEAYGMNVKTAMVMVRTDDKRYIHTRKPVPTEERVSHYAKSLKDNVFTIGNVDVFAKGFTDANTAVFIDGKLANKSTFLTLKTSDINKMTISDMFYYKELAKTYHLNQRAVIQVTTKSAKAEQQHLRVSMTKSGKKMVEVWTTDKAIYSRGLTDASTAIFINNNLANKEQFDKLKPLQIKELAVSGVEFQQQLAVLHNLKQKWILQVTLKGFEQKNERETSRLSWIDVGKKVVEVWTTDKAIYSRGLTDASAAIFINEKLADKKQFDKLTPSQINGMGVSSAEYNQELVKQHNLKQKWVLKVTLKDNTKS